jgi:hypothetical protein
MNQSGSPAVTQQLFAIPVFVSVESGNRDDIIEKVLK